MKLSRTLVAALLFAIGCGGQSVSLVPDGGAGGDAGPTTPCGRYAQAYCGRLQACTGGASITRNWGDMGTCLARQELSCSNGLGAPQTSQTTALVDQCAAALPSSACPSFLDNELPASCTPRGLAAQGAPCSVNAQCATGFCSGTRHALCGTCDAPPSAGASCAASNCGHGLACIWNSMVVDVCEPYVLAGAACGAFSDPICAAGLTCAGASSVTGVGGTCAPAIETVGTTCGSKNMNLGCDGAVGLWCQTLPGPGATCSDVLFGGDGAPCGYVPGGVTECTKGTCYSSGGPYFTYKSATTSTGTCRAFAADGAACDTSSGPGCLSPARCVTSGVATAGTCVVPTASLMAACR